MRLRIYCAVLNFIILFVGLVATSLSIANDDIDLTELSLEDLLQVKIVTSVGKKEQKLANAPAAVHVITGEEIRRSGARTIADALRMVPGLQVAQTNSHTWAISTRGFNSFFANKLLVLVDGRSVYTPEFSGVWWDTVDTILEDIERIEIIRGPGGTLWGANAVNGVINIITKHSEDTQGGLFVGGVGNIEQGYGSVRYGDVIDEQTDTYYRVYGKGFKRDNFENGMVDDGWQMGRAGFRFDTEPNARDDWMLQGGFYQGTEDDIHWFTLQPGENKVKGGHLLSSWTREFSELSEFTAQVYYDYNQRDMPAVLTTNHTLDFDFQHRYAFNDTHELLWGLGYRRISNKIPHNNFFQFNPAERNDNLWSAFVQDEITVIPEKFILTVGTKFEHNNYTGFEIQPNVRALWTPTEKYSLWGSVSRAVRTPSRREHNLFLQMALPPSQNPFYPTSLFYQALGNEEIESEEVLSYELGLRNQLTSEFSVDLTSFFNEYDNLIADFSGVFLDDATGNMISFEKLINGMRGETFGMEVVGNYYDKEGKWELQGGYSYLQMQLHADEGTRKANYEASEKLTPHHQAFIRSAFFPNKKWDLNSRLRYVDSLSPQNTSSQVSAYVAFDLRVAWRPIKDLELSLVGQSLFDNQHKEFGPSSVNPLYTEIPRLFYGQVRWEF